MLTLSVRIHPVGNQRDGVDHGVERISQEEQIACVQCILQMKNER